MYLRRNAKRAIKSGACAVILWIATIVVQRFGWNQAGPNPIAFVGMMVLGVGAVLATVGTILFTGLARSEHPHVQGRYRRR